MKLPDGGDLPFRGLLIFHIQYVIRIDNYISVYDYTILVLAILSSSCRVFSEGSIQFAFRGMVYPVEKWVGGGA